MKHLESHRLYVLVLAFVASGCGSCQQATPPTEQPKGQAKPAAVRTSAPTVLGKAAEVPTARSLATVEGAQRPAPTAGMQPGAKPAMPGAPKGPGEAAPPEGSGGEAEEEADCTVIADAEPDYGPPPLSVHCSVDFECTNGTGTVTWDFGDGSSPSHENAPTHTYSHVGEYVATVTITTPDGLSASDEVDISVEEEALDE